MAAIWCMPTYTQTLTTFVGSKVARLVPLPNQSVKQKNKSPQRCRLKQRNDDGDDAEPKTKSSKLALAASLFGTGFILGPLIDGIHSGVSLVVYQKSAIDIGPLHTNIWVPPLLGSFYLVVGLLQVSLDSTTKATPEKTASSFIALVLFIQLSALLYQAGIPDSIEAYVLFAAAQLIWLLFDNTASGFLLASIIGVACPLAEIPLIKFFNLWHYPQANVEIFGQGLVTWTITCYFAYTPFLINLSRYFNNSLLAAANTDTDT